MPRSTKSTRAATIQPGFPQGLLLFNATEDGTGLTTLRQPGNSLVLREAAELMPVPLIPLCVDLDGTLVKTDTLHEGLLRLLSRAPWMIFLVPLWLLRGKAAMKQEIARHAPLSPASLPYREDLLAVLREERAIGRRLVLATGADHAYARAVADYLGIFDTVLASDGVTNLIGKAKASALVAAYGEGEFDYVGDSSADKAVWERSRGRVIVEKTRPTPRTFRKALRVHQWVKNVLVFVPVFTSHSMFNLAACGKALMAFAGFSLTASAIYIINDLLDIDADRQHRSKRKRPFASGALSPLVGMALVPVLLGASFGIIMQLGLPATLALAVYVVLTFAYSFWLKRRMLTDVFALSMLYTIRILVGSAATRIPCSAWLLGFSVFFFLSLAFLKRAAELVDLAKSDRTEVTGRGYFTWDLVQVNQFGVTSGYMAGLVLALYINGEQVRVLYHQPGFLWLLVPMQLYWISRFWIVAHRGAMNEDPILFAARDRVTWFCGAAAGVILLLASMPETSWIGRLL